MEHRALFRNKAIIIVFCAAIAGCFFIDKKYVKVYTVNAADISLKQVADQLFYRDTLFNGLLYALYENGDSAFSFQYQNGKQNGTQMKWYPDMQPAEKRYYKKGKKEGTHLAWWENGNKKFEYDFSNNEHDGVLKEWFEDGRPARSFHYEKGYEVGNQRMWWPDGSIRANYDVRHGKRYGLQGEKLCQNTNDNAK